MRSPYPRCADEAEGVLVGWTSVGLRTSWSFKGIHLETGALYVVGVRAIDRAGYMSEPAFSNGQVYDA